MSPLKILAVSILLLSISGLAGTQNQGGGPRQRTTKRHDDADHLFET
jgi:hypothetical protein